MTLLAVMLAALTPAPIASPLLTITTVESHAVCSVLHSTVLPVAFIERKNQDAIDAMLNRDHRVKSSMIAWKPDYDFNALSEQYYTGVVWSNINLAEKLLVQSRGLYPDERYPYAAALRDRAEDVLDAERRVNSAIDAASGTYLDQTNGPSSDGAFGSVRPPLDPTPPPRQEQFEGTAFGDAAQRFIAATQQRPGTHLVDREAALARVVLAAYRFCEGRAENPQP